MTPDQAALLLYAIGIAICAVRVVRDVRSIEEADPLNLCDRCRDIRREWMTIAPALRDRAPWLLPLMVVLVAATWPVTVPRMGWRKIRYRKHVCEEVRRAAWADTDE